ncbi:uncharacterized protein LOC142349272 [Convolutriloba macropyga]|uniref:uncharacterized protein LOC142349272 n=1 Tax=Convolutriloba macropyga TaxID=536237 RepID=UPI003F522F2E
MTGGPAMCETKVKTQCCSHISTTTAYSQSLDELDFERSICGAAASNDFSKVKQMLEKAGSRAKQLANYVDKSGYTALHYASRAANPDIVQLLLNHGANVNATTKSTLATPLHRAAQCGHEKIIELLLNHNQECAASRDVKYLYRLGSEISSRDRMGNNDDSGLCDISLEDVDGKTPVDICVERKHWACLDLCVSYLKRKKDSQSDFGKRWSAVFDKLVHHAQDQLLPPHVKKFILD